MAIQSNIEQFVNRYVSKFRNVSEKRSQRFFIEKAIKQINFFLDNACCQDPDTTVAFARRDNELNIYIRAILNNKFDKRKYRKSLMKAVATLEKVLDPLCCIVDNFGPQPGHQFFTPPA